MREEGVDKVAMRERGRVSERTNERGREGWEGRGGKGY